MIHDIQTYTLALREGQLLLPFPSEVEHRTRKVFYIKDNVVTLGTNKDCLSMCMQNPSMTIVYPTDAQINDYIAEHYSKCTMTRSQ
jgi:hypothetical protein